MAGYGSGPYGAGAFGVGVSSRIEWNKPGERLYEVGIDRGVLYPRNKPAVPWNGLVSVNENPTGGDMESLYYDGVKRADVVSGEDFSAQLEAFSAPPEFAAADGMKMISPGLFAGQQRREIFGLCYRTLKGNDLQGTDYGYKLHIVYNCTAAPSGRTYSTLTNGSNSPATRTWTIQTVPPVVNTFRPTAHLVVDSTLVDPFVMEELESMLYGRNATEGISAIPAYLPTVEEILTVLGNTITELIEELV